MINISEYVVRENILEPVFLEEFNDVIFSQKVNSYFLKS